MDTSPEWSLFTCNRATAEGWHIGGRGAGVESHRIKLLHFMGTGRMQSDVANDAGGFQAVLVSSRATVTLPVVVEFWGRREGPLPVTAVIAGDIILGGRSIRKYFHTPLLSGPDATTERLDVL